MPAVVKKAHPRGFYAYWVGEDGFIFRGWFRRWKSADRAARQ